MKRAAFIACVVLAACAGTPSPSRTPAPAPTSSVAPGSSAPPPQAKPEGPRLDPDSDLPPRPKVEELDGAPVETKTSVESVPALSVMDIRGVAPRPPSCVAWTSRTPRGSSSVVHVLAQKDAATRDAMLAHRGFATVPFTALRADLMPVECADGITDPVLRTFTTERPLTDNEADMLVALSISSKLSRTNDAAVIDTLKSALTALRGYAWATTLVQAALADLRVGGGARKLLARDSLLTAFRELAPFGVLRDERIAKARVLMSNAFPDQRLDALDALLLPSWTPPAPDTEDEHALANAPAYWVRKHENIFYRTRWWLPGLASGVPKQPCHGLSCLHYARGRLELGRLFWRRIDFVEAAHLARSSKGDPGVVSLYVALALDLARGPVDATDRMSRRGTALGLHETPALDAFVKEGWPSSGMAAFDAALLRSLAVPEDETRDAYLADVSRRFEESASMLTDPAHRKRALEHARATKVRFK